MHYVVEEVIEVNVVIKNEIDMNGKKKNWWHIWIVVVVAAARNKRKLLIAISVL